jgi:hypothetical protein
LLRAICAKLSHFVRFPSKEEYAHIADEFSEWCKFGNVVGAVDGLIVPVKLGFTCP